METTCLSKSTTSSTGGSSSWNHQSLYRVEATGERLRITMRRDFYGFQSWAKLERWDGEQWREVIRKHGAETIILRTRPDNNRAVWSAVARELTPEAEQLISEQIDLLLDEAAMVLA